MVSLSRVEGSAALADAILALQGGIDPLRDEILGARYWLAIQQHVAPRIMARARLDFGVNLDEGGAIDLVVDRLGLQVEIDAGRRRDGTPKAPLLTAIARADDPVGYLIRVATKVADPRAPREPDRYRGWLQDHLIEVHRVGRMRSFDDLLERGVSLEAGPVGVFDEEGFAGLAAHTLDLVLRETPLELHEAVTAMVEWSVAALPQVAQRHEREERFRDRNRILMATELFGDVLSAAQISALHNMVWGPAEKGGERSSLVAHVARVRHAHHQGCHDRVSVVGKLVRDTPAECIRCAMSPLNGETLRALVNTYADNMARSLTVIV